MRTLENRDASSGFDFLIGTGETIDLVRSLDWSKNPLGLPDRWPSALKTTLGILFSSRHPMFLWWGPELIQFYNDAYAPSFGKGKHPAAMGQRGKDCWPEIWDIIHPQIADVMERGIPSWNENQLVPIFRNGRIEDVYWTYGYSPVWGENGRVAGTLVICQETTRNVLSRHEIEHAHREAEAARSRLLLTFNNAPAFVCLLSGPEHVFEMVNAPYQRLVGGGRQLLGKKLREALPEVAEQGFIQLLDGVYRENKPYIGRDTLARVDRSGNGVLEDAYVTFVYQPRLDARGVVDGIDVFGFEVTDQVRARLAAQTAAEANRVLAEAIPQQVWTASPDGALDSVNSKVLQYFGSTEDQVLGAGWQAVIHPDDLPGSVERWSHALRSGEEYEVEFRLRRSDGVYLWHLGRALPARDAKGTIVRWFGTNTNIDEQRKIREELNKRVEFEQYLMGIVSHDLRNPLGAIHLGASVLAKSESLDDRAARNVLRIQASAERGSRMIRDLLDFTQARLGTGIPLTLEEANIHRLAEQVIEEVRTAHPDRVIVLKHAHDGDGAWDSDRIAQVITNLCTNAVHYSPAGTPVTLVTRGKDDRVEIVVHNLGEPIPATSLPTLFEPLKRGVKNLDKATRSIGLGLYIVKAIVDGHGGEVAAVSEREAGTTFTVTLPRKPQSGASGT